MTHTPETTPRDTTRTTTADARTARGFALALPPIAYAAAALAILQTVLGIVLVGGGWGVITVHTVVAVLLLLSLIVATIAAGVLGAQVKNWGVFAHALTMAVLALVQYALGEMGARWVHVVLGVVLLLGIVSLATLARKRVRAA
ncbi:hypothetical protein JSY14_06830 [Brachybacterium sp. EF45031]|uniref:hypothetical protein n=1 Tax=Brachybacterium sillae TaxID=2810536 RepID=UPI00217E1F3C|nr:hypothetical protein [Brachybacterium sillae]MCS6711748.1 hypothetical protein [Brachybacterium sillae]